MTRQNTYLIWDLDLGTNHDWYTSGEKGSTPLEALRNAVAGASRHTAAFKDGHVVLVANTEGGHGEAAIFRITRKKAAPNEYIQEVVI